jgi:hypothetical protein
MTWHCVCHVFDASVVCHVFIIGVADVTRVASIVFGNYFFLSIGWSRKVNWHLWGTTYIILN